ncbi:hypothetical protein IFM89_016565 [Coptis chinensis]|uniref:Protein argonaute N-terminal domain-containing protein n=1 Tax=Coptis chinensis TaxID=261450 RepID=A0A835LZQ0_9MAGN|nr:hypothetical protein IFM89_016565 [Coptis chinensis]
MKTTTKNRRRRLRVVLRRVLDKPGTKCIVKANHFLVELPDKDLNHYHVAITPEPVVSSRRLNRAIMAQSVKLYRESDLGYKAADLWFTLQSSEGSNLGFFESRQREFKVTIKFVARADLQHLHQFLAGNADTPQEALQVLDIVLRELSTQRRVS